MPEPQLKRLLNKKYLQAIFGGIIVVLVVVLLVVSFPWLQLKFAEQLIESEKYAKAEPILVSLTANKPHWTDAAYKLVICQLYQGKGREAAQTVLSLKKTEEVDDLELAIVFMDVAKHLLTTGNGEASLELANRIGDQNQGDMLKVAISETGFLIAQYSELPLALDAVNLALSHCENTWQTNRKAFNLLLSKALESSPNLAEPALDRALELYPNNIIAVTRKATILEDKKGPQQALKFLLEKEVDLEDELTPEYLAIKRTFLLRLAIESPEVDLNQYTMGMPQDMLTEIALQGLNYAWLHTMSGRQYYHLAPDDPQVAYRYGRNLFQMHLWDSSWDTFRHLEKIDPKYIDFKAVYAALDSHTKAVAQEFAKGGIYDAVRISPDGKWMAWREWRETTQEENMISYLTLTNLITPGSKPVLFGNAILYEWSPDSKHLAFQTMTPNGLGNLHIITLDEEDLRYSLPPEYDIIDFNWAGQNLLVQARRENQTVLLSLGEPDWTILNERAWELNSDVNQDYSWLSIKDNSLLVHRDKRKNRTYNFENSLMSFTNWSPNGNLAIVVDTEGKNWIYNHQRAKITPIETPGSFAAWGKGEDIFWFLPLWDELHVMVRLNSKGSIREYLPYSFDIIYYDISITADGNTLAIVENDKILINKR
jgi:tetratricopeptide (TPR) repeat protein